MNRKTAAWVAVSLVLTGLGAVVALQPPGGGQPAKVDSPATPTDAFVPLPTTPEVKQVTVGKIDDPKLNWLSGRTLNVRVVTGQGVARPHILPVYVLAEASATKEAVGDNGQKLPAVVTVTVFDALEDPTARRVVLGQLQAEHNIVNPRLVDPESKTIPVGLVVTGTGKFSPVLLGESTIERSGGKTHYKPSFTVDAAHTHLLTRDAGEFSLVFDEPYKGMFVQNDLIVNVASIQTTLQSFRNSVTRVGQPDQKVAFVAFGGGANQNTLLKQHLSSLSRVELLTRQGATFNQDLLNWYLNKVVDPVIADTVKRIDPKADADKTFTFIIGNGISVQGTLGQFNKVETKDRLEAEKLMEDSKTWDRSLDVFTKLGFKVDTGVFGGFAKGESDVEFRLGKKDIGTAFRKDYSKDVRDMFQMAEGKFPVVALDVAQFQQSEMATAKAIEVTFNTFTIGRRNLTPSVSFQTLKASDISTDGKFLAFQTELEKRQARLESELAILAAKVGKLDTSKIHIDRVRVHWATPENNPLFTEIRDPQVKGTGPAGSRWLRQPVQFPEGRFTEAPDVVAGLASLEAPPTARVSIRTSEVTAKGFILEVWAWHDTVILEADVVYTAVAKPMK